MIGANLKKMARQGTAGQALVETALTLPVLTLVLLGCGEMARLAYASIEVANAAMAGAEYGDQNSGTAEDKSGIQTAASDETTDLVSSVTATPSVAVVCSNGTVPADSAGTGTPPNLTWLNTDCSTSQVELMLTVKTQATFSPLITVPGLPSSYTLHGYAIQRVLSY